MSKAEFERLWLLKKCYGRSGWHSQLLKGKKWDAHVAKLLKDGMLERDPNHGLYRITDKGLLAIKDK